MECTIGAHAHASVSLRAGLATCAIGDRGRLGASVTKSQLIQQLGALGVEAGGVLLVHAAFSRIAPLDDGPRGLIEALQAALGEQGTLVMPSMADDDDTPFDRRTMPCRGVGVLADTFWRMPGVMRSDSPHAFAAVGPQAARIT